ncbi:MAG: hypothetical protein GX619_07705 [Bacteroidales bacterium]|jgi:hypothetical protein|nr:hypothetical protein [Bacteroidales bacterium]
METPITETGCCPHFDPQPWDETLHEWHEKPFVKATVKTLFFMPLNFGSVMTRLMKQLDAVGATVPEGLGLSDHRTRWSMDIYVAVDKPVEGLENQTLSGNFFSKVYEGPYGQTAAWCKDFEKVVAQRQLKVRKWYMWYNYCPKCAKAYGKNYTTIIAAVEPDQPQ